MSFSALFGRRPRAAVMGAVVLGLATACGTDALTDLSAPAMRVESAATGLDQELRSLLLAASPRGVDAFLLPSSTALGRIPQDPKNPLTPQKVALGRSLYHETALAVDNVRPEGYETYSCASCHFAQAGFQANVPQGIAEGGSGFGAAGEGRVLLAAYNSTPGNVPDLQPIRTPTSMNTAYQELMLWNGQFGAVAANVGTEAQWTPGTPKESNVLGLHGLETQAHAGLGVHRQSSVELSRVATIGDYQRMFQLAFPGDGEISRLNAALAIGAFERTVLANEAPFQRWLRGDNAALTDQEKRGAILFFGEAGCVDCHTGPALSSMTFYAFGMNDLDGAYDPSRVDLAATGGTVPDGTRRGRGGFTTNPADDYKFKTPQLYNLASSPFYGHGASFASVRDVVEYKNQGVPENGLVPAGQLAAQFAPLGLTSDEVDDIAAFLTGGLYDANLMRYVPTSLPSGNCTPVNDTQARIDLGCS